MTNNMNHSFLLLYLYLLIFFLFFGCHSSTLQNVDKSDRTEDKKPQRLIIKPKARIAVVGFDVVVNTYGVDNVDKMIEDMLTSELIKTRYYRVIDRKRIAKVLNEQKFQYSGMVDPETAVKIGRILGAEAIVTGSLTEMGCSATSFIAKVTTCRGSIDVQVINVETAEIIAAETGNGRSDATLSGDARRALSSKDRELWVSEAIRSAAKDVSRKLANR